MPTFLFHPPGITIKIIGTDFSTHSRSCYDHHICWSLLSEDVFVRFSRLHILVDDKEESFISAHNVLDGTNFCCVGLLKSELARFNDLVISAVCIQAAL